MGCFSFICKESNLPVAEGDAVRIYLLKYGNVLEEMRGHYDLYGRVSDSNGESFEWDMDWSDVCDLMFNENDGDGIAVILEYYFKDELPTTQSDSDPDQGWGNKNGRNWKIDFPMHIRYFKS